MDFSEALKAMRMGNRIARYAWRGRIFYWEISKKGRDERILSMLFDGKQPKLVKRLPAEDVLAKEDWYVVT